MLGKVESGYLKTMSDSTYNGANTYNELKIFLRSIKPIWCNCQLPYDIATLGKNWTFHILPRSQVGDRVTAMLLQRILMILSKYSYWRVLTGFDCWIDIVYLSSFCGHIFWMMMALDVWWFGPYLYGWTWFASQTCVRRVLGLILPSVHTLPVTYPIITNQLIKDIGIART